MHTKISIVMHSTIQMKLYRTAIIQASSANTFVPIIPILSVHQYALIEQSPQCAYCMA